MTPELPTGCIKDEPIDLYHSRDALSCSKLKVFRHSPALYHGRFVAKTIPPPDETRAFFLGKAIESLALDGRAAHEAAYYVVPEGVGKVRVGDKAIREQLAARNPGKIALPWDDAQIVERINTNVHAHHLAGPLLAACEKQVTFRIKGEHFYVQVRPDAWAEEGCELTQGVPVVVDLKTIPELPDDDADVIPRQCAAFWYAGQARLYRDVVATVMKYPPEFRPLFYFVFVAKEEPYNVKVVELDKPSLDLAFRQLSDTLERLKTCITTNHWPLSWDDTFKKKVTQVSLPAYVLKKEMEKTDLW